MWTFQQTAVYRKKNLKIFFLTQCHQALFIKLPTPFNVMTQQASDYKYCWIVESLVTKRKGRSNCFVTVYRLKHIWEYYCFFHLLYSSINKHLPDSPIRCAPGWFGQDTTNTCKDVMKELKPVTLKGLYVTDIRKK